MSDRPESGGASDRLVFLEEVLAARDRRAARQRAMLATWQQPLVSITLVMPGARKNPPFADPLLRAAVEAARGAILGQGWALLAEERRDATTGPEALLCVGAHALDLKRAMTVIEETDHLGRLWDLDVIACDGLSVGRRVLGLPARRCLICEDAAHLCTRSRRHNPEDLFSIVAETAHAHLDSHGGY